MNVSLPDATAYNSKQLAIQKDMTPSLYAMFFKVTYNVPWLYFSSGKVKNQLSVMPKIYKYTQSFD